jgi:hypothetical protein
MFRAPGGEERSPASRRPAVARTEGFVLAPPSAWDAKTVLGLQRLVGNTEVARLLAPPRDPPSTPPVAQRMTANVVDYLYKEQGDADVKAILVSLESNSIKWQTGTAGARDVIRGKLNREFLKTYIENGNNPARLRRALRDEWNKRLNKGQQIDLPADLVVVPTPFVAIAGEDFSGYDSEEETEKNMDIQAALEAATIDRVDLYRAKGMVKKVPVLSLFNAIRINRQLVKRKLWSKVKPFVVVLGDHAVEYSKAGREDIFAFPLITSPAGRSDAGRKRPRPETPTPQDPSSAPSRDPSGSSGQPPPSKRRRLQRTGGTTQHSWQNLAKRLKAEHGDDPVAAVRSIFEVFKGKEFPHITESAAAAIAAIGSDFKKGASGAMHFVLQVLNALDEVHDDARPDLFHRIFVGERPLYEPAAGGGRKKATLKSKELRAGSKKGKELEHPRVKDSEETVRAEAPGEDEEEESGE